jgi:hypothetical protein
MVMDSTIMNKDFDVYSPTGPLKVIEYATFSILEIKIARNLVKCADLSAMRQIGGGSQKKLCQF